ncbi:MAG: TIR domain-containing protein [Synergistaceae bacterium]|nr:TIR domain-containing protein [Synergistaceae bacterium]
MRRVFYSFHYAQDSMRVMLIRNIQALESDEPVLRTKWEEIKRAGDLAIKRWINKAMASCSCVVVLIGEETSRRPWVRYEIQHAWEENKGLLGIYIHNLKPVNNSLAKLGKEGKNPFLNFQLTPKYSATSSDDKKIINLSDVVPVKNPDPKNAYNDIRLNIASWVEEAIKIRKDNYFKNFKIEETDASKVYGNIM